MLACRTLGVFLLAGLLEACGGGGGASGNNTSWSLSTQSVTATDLSTDLNGPGASVSISVQNPPVAGLYVTAVLTTNAITSVNFYPSSSTVGTLQIAFKTAISLGVGVYTDSIAVSVCYDRACKQPVSGSPQTVKLALTITQGNPAVAMPVIASMNPTTVIARSPQLTLTVNDVNFAAAS